MGIDIRPHHQDDDKSCGRACAQMIIGFEWAKVGVLSGTALPNQATMANSETGTENDWETEPAELATHINDGLAAGGISGVGYTVFEAKAPLGSSTPKLDVANALLEKVRSNLDCGVPSVVMVDDNDHWEVARDHGPNPEGEGYFLFTFDPLPSIGPTVHSDTDPLCAGGNTNSIWFFDDEDAAKAVICDVAPFVGSAIAIVRELTPDPALLNAGRLGRRLINPTSVPRPNPLAGRTTQAAAVIEFLRRGLWRMLRAFEKLPEPARLDDFDWSQMVVRQVQYTGSGGARMHLVGVPPRASRRRSMLMSLTDEGTLRVVRMMVDGTLVAALRRQSSELLWIVRKYGRWQPFVVAGREGDKVRLERLHDGLVIVVPASDVEPSAQR